MMDRARIEQTFEEASHVILEILRTDTSLQKERDVFVLVHRSDPDHAAFLTSGGQVMSADWALKIGRRAEHVEVSLIPPDRVALVVFVAGEPRGFGVAWEMPATDAPGASQVRAARERLAHVTRGTRDPDVQRTIDQGFDLLVQLRAAKPLLDERAFARVLAHRSYPEFTMFIATGAQVLSNEWACKEVPRADCAAVSMIERHLVPLLVLVGGDAEAIGVESTTPALTARGGSA